MKFWKIKILVILLLFILMWVWISLAQDNWNYLNFKTNLSNEIKNWNISLSIKDSEKIVQIVDKELVKYWINKEFDLKINNDDYKNIITIFLAILYAFLYTLTIKQIIIEYHLISSASFIGFSITNFWLWISSGFHIWSLWYFIAFIMWAITVILNEIIKRKLISWELKTKIPRRRFDD